jgi:hypothetical protein
MAKERHARLVYLSRALQSLEMLISVTAGHLSHETCNAFADELEPIVRDMAAKMEEHVPKLLLLPLPLDPHERIDEIIEFEMRDLKENLARVDAVKAAFPANRS